jgi:hypothetical protein
LRGHYFSFERFKFGVHDAIHLRVISIERKRCRAPTFREA